ncbi:FAD-binding protein [Cryobacterium frigoriphilum]|uniref:FAD-binding protein n=1 Tax=Cryobacterium frigoriphilum TaxID=1259150 RepID=A0A4R9A1F2_9MICO|nr:NAD(P)/FAD-dependent oxidoreductase [Cryobacterium frigoriphilum]TFD50202.1 FAD-binding protein [Cryobacterium frigoriphilum]
MITRRTLLLGTASGLSVLALAGCTTPEPEPTPSVTGTPTPTLVPQPLTMRRTNWAGDAFARGSFSFAAVGATPEHRAALREPVADRVFFAGEATAISEPGTVQGARESGLRAAAEVEAIADQSERIAVIGAGMAGLSAARLLVDAGYDVIVIEARDRTGGRIDTVTDADWPFPIELGPSFIRSSATTDLDEQLTVLGAASLEFTTEAEVRTRAGTVVAVDPVGAEAVADALVWAADQARDVSLERAIVDSGNGTLSTTVGDTGVSPADWLDYDLATGLKVTTGAGPGEVSAWYAPGAPATSDTSTDANTDATEDAPAVPRLVIGGYRSLLDDLATDIDVVTSNVVTLVAYDDDGVSLRLGAGESLSVDRVVVTIPLGVLQDEALEFSPALPFAHRGAIAALGMGVLDKVWLRFDEAFWSTDAPLWTIVGGDPDFAVWVNLLPLTGEPVLMGVVAAENADRLSQFSDDDFLVAALSALEPFLAAP